MSALISTADIEAYLGTTLDSAETAVYSDIIDAVSAWIACYCDTNFDDDVYSERIHVIDNNFTLSNRLNYFYGVSYGVTNAITVVGPSNLSSIRISADGDTLTLIDTFTTTDINIAASTLSQAVTLISAEAGWTATLVTGVDNDYAKTLYAGSFRADTNDSNTVTLLSANELLTVSQVSRNLFQCNVECTEAIAIYQGGYVLPPLTSTVPADLVDATIRFTIKAYTDRNVSSASGTKKSEKIGDYSYTNFTVSEESGGLSDLAIEYKGVLDCYAINKSI